MESWKDIRKTLYSPEALVIADRLMKLYRLQYSLDRKKWIVLLGDTIDEYACGKKYTYTNCSKVCELHHEIQMQIDRNERLLMEVAERER